MYRRWSAEEVKTVKEMSQKGYTDIEIAKKLNRTKKSVSAKRYKTGIEQRKLNENLFDNWTYQNSWLIGLITADGSFDKRGDIILYNTNKNLLKEFKKIMETRNKINTSQKGDRYGSKKVWRLAVNSDKLIKFFKSINGYGIKQQRNPFPLIPDKYKWSFIKGLFDGDGNFYKGTMSIAGRKQLIKVVYYWICRQINKFPNKIYQSTISDKTYYFQLHKSDTVKVAAQIEENTNKTFNSEKYLKLIDFYEKNLELIA